MKHIILFLLFSIISFAQLENLQKIRIDEINYTNFERSFVFEGSGSLYYFYRQKGSSKVYVDASENYGQTWDSLNVISGLTFASANPKSFDIIQTGNTEFKICYLEFSGILKLFDYNVLTNTLTQMGSNHSINSNAREIELTKIDELSFLISFRDYEGNLFYLKTDDGAGTWSEKQYFPGFSTGDHVINVTLHNGNLYAAQSENESIRIITGTTDASEWNSPSEVFLNDAPVPYASIYSNGSELFLVFEEEKYVELIDENQTDICFIVSDDNGISWSAKNKYTNFIGNDLLSEITVSSGNLLAVILSNRTDYIDNNSYVGFLPSSIDPAPPIIYSVNLPSSLHYDTNFIVNLFVNDETGIGSVIAEFNNQTYELYDDGAHNDSLAGDNIYGTEIPGFPSTKPNTSSIITINNISMPLDNTGNLAHLDRSIDNTELKLSVQDVDENSIEILKNYRIFGSSSLGSYKDINFLFSGGFYLSGYQNSELWANAVASSSLTEDYLPGNVGSSPEDSKNLIYSVLESDPPFGEAWQNWRTAVEQGAYFYDGDNDGVYNPVDKNNNGVWDPNEDKPDILYDGTYFTVFNDGRPAEQRRFGTVDPLGIEVRQTAFASAQNSILDDVLFVRYSVLYKGLGNPSEPDTLKDAIFSIWNDADIGDAVNDRVGCDTTLQAGYTYNDYEYSDWDTSAALSVFNVIVQGPLVKTGNPDDIAFNRKGPALGEETFEGYLNSEINAFTHNQSGVSTLDIPNNPEQARNYTLGQTRVGSYPDPCDWSWGDVLGGIDCAMVNKKFWYSGDPVTEYGWINRIPSDQRSFTNTEMFDLVKDQPMDIIVAYVVGQGTDALNSITRAREITQYVHDEYQRNFSTLVGVDDKPEEVVNKYSLSQNYPNPFNPTTTIKFSIPNVGRSGASPYNTKLVVYDILGQKVKTLVNEVKSPGNYEVTFNASQLASGVYFYRLTAGDFIQTKKMILLR